MIRKTSIASMFVVILLAGGFFLQSAHAEGKRTTDHKWDGKTKTATDTVKDADGKLVSEKVTEYDKDDRIKKQTITEYYANGKGKSVTVIIYDKNGSHATREDFDEDGNPNGKSKGKTSTIIVPISLRATTFNSAYGSIIVNLPSDMAAGDTISGTVFMNPIGHSDAERARNSDELSGYVVQLDGVGNATKANLGRIFRFAIPAGSAALSLKLISPAGVPAQVVEIPVAPQGLPLQEDFVLPRLGQAGRSLNVQGPFDGDMTNTSLQLDARDVTILAESPRLLVFEAPSAIAGPGGLTLKEGSATVVSQFNNLRVSLTAPVTRLMKGEKTVVTAKVEGLQGLPAEAYPLSLQLMNMSPAVIALDNAKSATLEQPLRYSAVDPGGCYSVSVPVRGIRAGSYTISATAHSTNAAALSAR